jgi:hypothetical protein
LEKRKEKRYPMDNFDAQIWIALAGALLVVVCNLQNLI